MSEQEPADLQQGLCLNGTESVYASIKAVVDYRGDVTVTRANGQTIDGYVFDCTGCKDRAAAQLRLLPRAGGGAVTIPMTEVAAIEVTGRDTAEGKSFETWVRKYVEKMKNATTIPAAAAAPADSE